MIREMNALYVIDDINNILKGIFGDRNQGFE